MTVVIAFDGDDAGQQAADNALLTALDARDEVRDYLRAYIIDKKPFREAIRFLGNEELTFEYRFWSHRNSRWPDWMVDEFRKNAEECMALMSERASKVELKPGSGMIAMFNAENTITDVLAAHGSQGVPGRSTRCPSHDDSTPSLSISRDNKRAYCFNQSCPLWNDNYGVDPYELNKILSK